MPMREFKPFADAARARVQLYGLDVEDLDYNNPESLRILAARFTDFQIINIDELQRLHECIDRHFGRNGNGQSKKRAAAAGTLKQTPGAGVVGLAWVIVTVLERFG